MKLCGKLGLTALSLHVTNPQGYTMRVGRDMDITYHLTIPPLPPNHLQSVHWWSWKDERLNTQDYQLFSGDQLASYSGRSLEKHFSYKWPGYEARDQLAKQCQS